jgi:hypothetical protein
MSQEVKHLPSKRETQYYYHPPKYAEIRIEVFIVERAKGVIAQPITTEL